MNVTYRIDKDILYIAIEGRVDASNAAEAESKIFNIKNPFQSMFDSMEEDEKDENTFADYAVHFADCGFGGSK